jgi:3-hydroxyacyl-[acyl-carrier-protein] dehydratase
LIPHRPPFLLIDRVLSADPTTGRLVALRRLSADDALGPAAQEAGARGQEGSAPTPAEFPRPLLIEALCQAAACLNGLGLGGNQEAPGGGSAVHRGFLVAISGFRFPDSAYIGETVELSVTRRESLGAVVAFDASATVIENAASPKADRAANDDQSRTAIAGRTALAGRTAIEDRAALPRTVAAGRLLFAVTLT